MLSALVENFLACSHPILSHIPNTITKLKYVKVVIITDLDAENITNLLETLHVPSLCCFP